MYIDSMQQIYSSVTKIMIDSRQGSNLLYLPLDKIIQMTGQTSDDAVPAPLAVPPAGPPANAAAAPVAHPALPAPVACRWCSVF